eukprot:2543119-Pyramimonas_sp.AAC.1
MKSYSKISGKVVEEIQRYVDEKPRGGNSGRPPAQTGFRRPPRHCSTGCAARARHTPQSFRSHL